MMSNDPPPPRDSPQFSILGMLGSADPKSSTLTNFSRHITNLRVLGFAEPKIPWYANRLDLQRRCACWKFRNFTDVD